MRQASQINDDLLCSEAIDNPYAYFGRLRECDPVHWNPLWQGWILTRYQDVVAVLHDAVRFSSDRMAYLETHASADKRQALTTYLTMLSRWLVFMDPPDHTHLRLLLQRASFTPRQLLAWRPRIQAIVDELLAQIEPGKPVDFIQAVAFPLPVLVVSEILGFPPEDRNQVRHWTTDVALPFFLSLGMDARTKWARAEQAAKEFSAYARALLQDRQHHPRDDLLTAMVQAEHPRGAERGGQATGGSPGPGSSRGRVAAASGRGGGAPPAGADTSRAGPGTGGGPPRRHGTAEVYSSRAASPAPPQHGRG
jgi:cytochrome P450